MKTLRTIFGVLVTACQLHSSTPIVLINEDFSQPGFTIGTTWSNNGLNWIWSNTTGSVSPLNPEVYDNTGSNARGMPWVHGGFEIFSYADTAPEPGSIWQVSVSVALPNLPENLVRNEISFDIGYRGNISASWFKLYNSTDQRTIFAGALYGDVGSWETYTLNPTFTNEDAGDTVELVWSDSAVETNFGGRGLQVGAVNFTVPEPSALSLFAIGLSGLAMMSRRRS